MGAPMTDESGGKSKCDDFAKHPQRPLEGASCARAIEPFFKASKRITPSCAEGKALNGGWEFGVGAACHVTFSGGIHQEVIGRKADDSTHQMR